jgi:hypothetical protein
MLAAETTLRSVQRHGFEGLERVRREKMTKPAEQDAQGEKQKEMEMLDRLGIMRGVCEPSLLRLRLATHCAVENRM